MIRVLIADDERNIRTLIRKYADYEGFDVYEAETGLQAVEMCRFTDFDIIIMDIMMPVLDGFSACKEIRKNKNIPVIMLSALGEEYDKIHGFELGVDDYVVKPFSGKELMMRIKAVINRVKGSIKTGQQMVFEKLVIDTDARTVEINGVRVEMTMKEYDLLVYLAKNRGIALSRDRLISEVWGYDFYGDDRTLDSHIKMLRKSLGEYSRLITTIRGVGYRFEKE